MAGCERGEAPASACSQLAGWTKPAGTVLVYGDLGRGERSELARVVSDRRPEESMGDCSDCSATRIGGRGASSEMVLGAARRPMPAEVHSDRGERPTRRG